MSRIKNGGLDQYGAEPFEQQQFATVGVEGVNNDATEMKNEQIGTIKFAVSQQCLPHYKIPRCS